MSKPKRHPKYVWLKVARLVDPETGEVVGAFVPQHAMDAAEIRRRGYKVGTALRADLKMRRNPQFYRLAHAMAKIVAQGVDGFDAECESEDWHAALKRLQRESGVACETVETEVPGLGTLQIKQAQSLAFDELGEDEFRAIYRGITSYVCREYWPHMEPRAVEEMAMNMVGREAEAA